MIGNMILEIQLTKKTIVLEEINMNISPKITDLMITVIDSQAMIIEGILDIRRPLEAHQDTTTKIDPIREVLMGLHIETIQNSMTNIEIDIHDQITLEAGQDHITLEVIHIIHLETDHTMTETVNNNTIVLETLGV